MTAPLHNGDRSFPARTLAALRSRFSLQADRAEDSEIIARIRTDMTVQGTTLWVLMFAILIASIGLHVNSTAVIIGVMLISPLMGPIMGVGYRVGVGDFGAAGAYDTDYLGRLGRDLWRSCGHRRGYAPP
jgi:hypothetical protein